MSKSYCKMKDNTAICYNEIGNGRPYFSSTGGQAISHR